MMWAKEIHEVYICEGTKRTAKVKRVSLVGSRQGLTVTQGSHDAGYHNANAPRQVFLRVGITISGSWEPMAEMTITMYRIL